MFPFKRTSRIVTSDGERCRAMARSCLMGFELTSIAVSVKGLTQGANERTYLKVLKHNRCRRLSTINK